MSKIRPALIFPVGGAPRAVPAFDVSLASMQKAVGGFIERVPGVPPKDIRELGERYGLDLKGASLWCNEEGRIRNLPLNKLASTFADQYLFGNVLVVRM